MHRTESASECCCFWIQSERCENLKIAAVSLIAALAAAAIAAGLLLILARKGYNLGGINPIAQMIEAKWIYTSLGVAGGVVLIDTLMIIAMLRSYLNREAIDTRFQYLESEDLYDLKIQNYIATKHIYDKLLPGHYWKVTKEQVIGCDDFEGSEACFAVVIKNEQGEILTKCFKSSEKREAFIKKKGCLKDGRKAYETSLEYPAEFIKVRFGKAAFEGRILNLSEGLHEGFYLFSELDIPGTEKQNPYSGSPIKGGGDRVEVLVAKTSPSELHFHFCKPGKLREILDAHYSNLIHKERAEKIVSKESQIQEHTKSEQKAKDTHNNRMIDGCNGVLADMNGPEEAIKQFHLGTLLSDMDVFKLNVIHLGKTYYICIYRDADNKIVQAVYPTERKRALGSTGRDVTAAVEKMDHAALEEALFGDQGIIHTHLIDKIVTQRGHYWLEERLDIKGESVALLCYHDGNSFQSRIFFNERTLQKFKEFHANQLHVDMKSHVEKSDEYPEELGKALAEKTYWNLAKFKEKELIIFIDEYLLIQSVDTGIVQYPQIATILIRKPIGNVKYHFFKSEAARNQFRDKKLATLQDSLYRVQSTKKWVELVGHLLQEKGSEEAKAPFWHADISPDQKMAHLVRYAVDGSVHSYYLAANLVEKEVMQLKEEGHMRLPLHLIPNEPLSVKEREHLSSICKKNFERWITKQELKTNEFVVIPKLNNRYFVYLYRDDNDSFVKQYFRANDPKIAELKEKLKGYTNALKRLRES